MFGYVRPLKGELKVYEFENFKAAYCGLCHTLGKRYGLPARFILSYDMAFFAAVAHGAGGEPMKADRRRCIAHPLRRRCVLCRYSGQELAADLTIILTHFKLRDAVMDAPKLKKPFYAAALLLFSPFWRRARRYRPMLAEKTGERLSRLWTLEKERCDSLDLCADQFAALLTAAADELGEAQHRQAAQLFYHLGRWIYIIDACDDLKRDCEKGQYNPVALRYDIKDGVLPPDIKEEITVTLSHSRSTAASALALMDLGPWMGFASNVINYGLPATETAVLEGRWRKSDERPV